MRARAQHCRWSNVGPPNFRCIPFARDVLLDPGRMAVPRLSALLMLRSTISTVSAPATCLFRGSITNPTQLLCTLRGRRYRRLTQHLLPGGPLRPYPDRSCSGWTAPAFVGAFGNCGYQAIYAGLNSRGHMHTQGATGMGNDDSRRSISRYYRGLKQNRAHMPEL